MLRKALKSCLLVMALGVICYAAFFSRACPLDFPEYYCAGMLYMGGHSITVYDENALSELQHRTFPQMPRIHRFFPNLPADPSAFWYPPYALPLFAWLTLLPPSSAIVAWSCLSVAAFALSLFFIGRLLGLSANVLCWAVIVAGLSGPFAQAFVLGQPTYFILCTLVLAMWAVRQGKMALAGLAVALLFAKPPVALPLLMYLLGARRYRLLGYVALLGFVAVIFSWLTAGAHTYTQYLQTLKFNSEHPQLMATFGCITVRAQLLRWFPDAAFIVNLFTLPLYAATLIWSLVAGCKFAKSNYFIEAFLVGVFPLTLVLAPYFQPYDLSLLLPSAMAFTAVKWPRSLPQARAFLLVSYLLLFTFIVYTAIYFADCAVNPHIVYFLLFAGLGLWYVWQNRHAALEKGEVSLI